jgi:hypothetical protein
MASARVCGDATARLACILPLEGANDTSKESPLAKPHSEWTVLPHGKLKRLEHNLLSVTGTMNMPPTTRRAIAHLGARSETSAGFSKVLIVPD